MDRSREILGFVECVQCKVYPRLISSELMIIIAVLQPPVSRETGFRFHNAWIGEYSVEIFFNIFINPCPQFNWLSEAYNQGLNEPNDGMIPRYYGGEHPRLPCGRTGSIIHRVERAFFAIPETIWKAVKWNTTKHNCNLSFFLSRQTMTENKLSVA